MKQRRGALIKDKKITLTAELLMYFFVFVDFMPLPLESKRSYTKRLFKSTSTNLFVYYRIMRKLEEKGWIKIYRDKETNKNLYCLTESGRLEALFLKAQLPDKREWDEKWRMVVFDIPESARPQRNRLRQLLKINGFKTIQKSVYVNPQPLNAAAIDYLEKTNLNSFIRIFRIDQADNDQVLRKMFNL